METCKLCDGMGMRLKLVSNGAERSVEPCECQAARRIEQAGRRAKIPQLYADRSLASFETKGAQPLYWAAGQARRYVEQWKLQGGNIGLLMTGPVGVGKTHLAVGILKELILRGVLCYFVDFRELLKSVQETYSGASGMSEADVLRPALTRELVVLDELGAGRVTDWTADAIEHIINTRYNGNLTTIVTTNYVNRGPGESASEVQGYAAAAVRQDTLGDRIGARMWSRLQEMCAPMEMRGEDHRRAAR